MTSSPYQNLYEKIKKTLGPQPWKQGHKLVEMGLVEGLRQETSEIELLVRAPGTAFDPEVLLYPEDLEWECSCGARDDRCAHVAAAVIALEKAHTSGQGLPRPTRQATSIAYHLTTGSKGLTLRRTFVGEKASEPLKRPLLAQLVSRQFPLGYKPNKRDLAADRAIGRAISPHRPLSADAAVKLLNALGGAEQVYLNNDPIQVSELPLLPIIKVESADDGAVLRLFPNPDLDEVIGDGVVRCGRTLYPVGQRGIVGNKMERLPRTITYRKKDLAELVADVLPQLEKDNFVEVLTTLPELSRFLKPRLIMNMNQRGSEVDILPQLVYGDPPHVRVEQDRMVYLQGSIPVRDRKKEAALNRRLRDDLNLIIGRKVTFGRREAAEFLQRSRTWSEEVLDSSQHVLGEDTSLIPNLLIDEDRFDLTFTLPPGTGHPTERMATAKNVLEAWMEGLALAPLEGGGFAPMPTDWLEAHGHQILDILDARDEAQKVSPAAFPTVAALCDDLGIDTKGAFAGLEPLFKGFEGIDHTPPPPAFKGQLRHYQQQGLNWLSFLRKTGIGGILADDMGLGKTVQALCAINGKTLVVCPTSVLHNWANESARFRPDLKVSIYHGTKRTIDLNADLIITNYALLRIDKKELGSILWETIILDEAQNIKNPASQVARAACSLQGKFKLAMSGTPVENRLEELWSIFNFTSTGLLGRYKSFQRRYCVPIGGGDDQAAQRLRARIKPFILRRKKDEVELELPARTDLVMTCELSEMERATYEAIRETTNNTVLQQLKKGGSVMAALEQLLRLRQAACHTDLIPGCHAPSSSKVSLLIEALQESRTAGHRALVFSQWTGLLDRIEPHLKKKDLSYSRLDGTTRKRDQVIDQFQATDGPEVMLISLKAGGTGLNLTAADHVYITDPWWNPAVEDQAADRIHRIGQDKPVFVYRLVATNTVEERILDLQEKKRALAASAVDGAKAALSITRDDLITLLEP